MKESKRNKSKTSKQKQVKVGKQKKPIKRRQAKERRQAKKCLSTEASNFLRWKFFILFIKGQAKESRQ